MVDQAGRVLVGETGPEMLTLPHGATVAPLGSGDTHIHIEIHNPVITTEEVARSIARQIAAYVSEFIETEKRRL